MAPAPPKERETFASSILVGTDLSDASLPAIKEGARLAAASGACLTLLHVFDPTPNVPPDALPNAASLTRRMREELEGAVRATLQNLVARWVGDSVDAQIAPLEHRQPASAICQFAREQGADLIVLSTHGRAGLGHGQVGSVTERVVRQAPTRVLVVPSFPHGVS